MRHGFLFSVPLMLLCLWGCGEKGETTVSPWIYIDKSNETIGEGGGDFLVHLEATYDWEQRIQYDIKTEYDWLSLSQAFGFGNLEYDIKVRIDPNYDEERAATVVFYLKGYDKKCELRIVQEGSSYVELSAPSGLQASVSGYTIYLSWNSVSGASYYNVYYSSSSSVPRNYLGYSEESSCSWTANSIGTYYFAITAVDMNGNESPYSNYASCTVSSGSGGGGGGGGTTPSKPSTPTGVKANLSGENIIVSWNASNGAKYYQVYYDRPYPYNGAIFENCYQTSMTFYPKTIYGTWTFWVVAVSSDYQLSDPSPKVTVNYTSGGSGGGGGGGGQSQLSTPQNLEAASGYSFVQISFDPVSGAYDYYLYRSTSANSGYSKISASGGSSGSRYVLTDQNPKSGTTYYKVKAIALPSTGIKDSEYSSYVKVTR